MPDASHRTGQTSARVSERGLPISIGVDVGGTFTDVVLTDEAAGHLYTVKLLTTPDRPALAVIDGIRRIIETSSSSADAVGRVVHATTLATNVLVERKGARTAFVTTEGFGDMFELGQYFPAGPDRFNVMWRKPEPLVERSMVVEINERLDPSGETVRALDLEEAHRKLETLAPTRPDAVAVCLLHSYANSTHERQIGHLLANLMPDVYVVLSSDIWPEIFEYERASTTVASAYVGPILAAYLGELVAELPHLGISASLQVMQSSGSVVTASGAIRRAIQTLESGPAAGVIMTCNLGARLERSNLISFDMGGTTAKVGLVWDDKPLITHEFRAGVGVSHAGWGGGEPIKTPTIDLVEVGAGGGSVAWIDAGGFLKVGPRSAGAAPGPACYGLGGTEPTVTDANVVLGYLNPEYLLGGAMTISRELSERAILDLIADPLGISVMRAAERIHQLSNVAMGAAIRAMTLQRGADPRDFAIVAFGGAGPLHIARLAQQFEIQTIIIPPLPGVASAIGLLNTDPAVDFVTTRIVTRGAEHIEEIEITFDSLEQQGRKELAEMGFKESDLEFERSVDMRFTRQNQVLTVPFPAGAISESTIDAMEALFRDTFSRTLGVASADQCTFVNFRIRAISRLQRSGDRQDKLPDRESQPTPTGMRLAYFGDAGGFVETAIYERADLEYGHSIVGPAIVEQADSTTLCPPGLRIQVDQFLNLVIGQPTSR